MTPNSRRDRKSPSPGCRARRPSRAIGSSSSLGGQVSASSRALSLRPMCPTFMKTANSVTRSAPTDTASNHRSYRDVVHEDDRTPEPEPSETSQGLVVLGVRCRSDHAAGSIAVNSARLVSDSPGDRPTGRGLAGHGACSTDWAGRPVPSQTALFDSKFQVDTASVVAAQRNGCVTLTCFQRDTSGSGLR